MIMSNSPFNPYQPPASDEADSAEGPASSPSRLILANRRQRLYASLIDGLLGMMITLPVRWKFGFFLGATPGMGGLISWQSAPLTAATTIAWLALNTYFLSQRSQTLGKVITHIRIVNEADGLPAPLRRTIVLRYLPVAAVSLLPVLQVLTLVDIAFIFRKDHRCLHDLIAGTVVVKVR